MAKARPRSAPDAVVAMACTGSAPRPRSSTKRSRMREVNSVHTAISSGPETAVSGLSFRDRAQAIRVTDPTAIITGTRDSSDRMTLRSRMARKTPTKMSAR